MSERCKVYKGSAVDDWALEQYNFAFSDPGQCEHSAYMYVTEEAHDDDPVPVCKTHGEAWLGNEKGARVTEILVATPEEVAAAIASIQEGRPMT